VPPDLALLAAAGRRAVRAQPADVASRRAVTPYIRRRSGPAAEHGCDDGEWPPLTAGFGVEMLYGRVSSGVSSS
jgi:hypothetical protein